MERSIFREYAEAFIIAIIFLRFTQIFILQTFFIPSGSMENTLLIGDHLFVNRHIYGATATDLERRLLPMRDVERGDIVIFRSPENPNIDVVKRCVGVPGDTVDVQAKQLYINGKAVQDAGYAIHSDPISYSEDGTAYLGDQALSFRSDEGRVRDNFGPKTVPEGHYLCMGDNRDKSYDSRFWGMLPRRLVKGRALFIYWSNGGPTDDGEWRGLGSKLGQLGRTALGFFSNTRWERTFRLIR
ncbi:MAG TPA: signal peptidase I [Acidobacteria bacterium]|nr:signal peptidase I [Acidobacteriota bacterium]